MLYAIERSMIFDKQLSSFYKTPCLPGYPTSLNLCSRTAAILAGAKQELLIQCLGRIYFLLFAGFLIYRGLIRFHSTGSK